MEVVALGRQKGKTRRAIEQAHKTKAYIVCANKRECQRIFEEAQKLKLSIPLPITYAEWFEIGYTGGNIKGFIIDNVELLVQYLTNVPIEMITVNVEQSDKIAELEDEIAGLRAAAVQMVKQQQAQTMPARPAMRR